MVAYYTDAVLCGVTTMCVVCGSVVEMDDMNLCRSCRCEVCLERPRADSWTACRRCLGLVDHRTPEVIEIVWEATCAR